VAKQVYLVKKNGRKCDISDSFSNKKQSVKLTLATEGKEMQKVIVEARVANTNK
jgi:hypothetical protein